MPKIFLMKTMHIIIKIRHKLFLCVAAVCHFSLIAVFAQDLDRQLILVRPFDPSVMDAQKITTLPNLRDSFNVKPSFEYSIESKRIDTQFDVSPITPARLQPLPQTRLYNGYIKIGAGTLPNVLAEVAVNTLRNRDYAAGALFKLDRAGMDGKVRIDNENFFAGYNDISGTVFGKRFFRNNSILYGDLGASMNTVYNYGYDIDAFKMVDDVKIPVDTAFVRGDILKRYVFADAKVGIRSSHFRTNQLNYDVQLAYNFARNKLGDVYVPDYVPDINSDGFVKYHENAVNFKAQLDNNMFGGNVNMDIYNRSNAFDSLRNNFAIEINPWFMLDNDSVRMKIGARVSNFEPYIYPSIEFQFTMLKDIFIPFIGYDGYLRPNTYRAIVEENPFITPGLAVPMTKTKMQIYAGLKGTITSKLSYYLRADFFSSENEYFFVNDTAYSHVQNHFTVIADNLMTYNIRLDLYFNPIEALDFGLKFNYSHYAPKIEVKAWHKPEFTFDFSAKYNHRNKIIAGLDVICIGKRYAKKFFDPDKEFIELNSAFAVSIGAEYRYTKNLSFFTKINSGAKYERWNFFPSHKFNAMAGFTYSL